MTTTDLTQIQDRLTEAAGGDLRPGGADDRVGGMPCRWVVRPTTTAEVAAVMRVAHDCGLAVVPRGSGTKIGWGAAPERLDVVLELSGLDALVEHAAGDLITIVGAGRRVAELQHDLAGSNQWLAVEPSRAGTVGGLVATASTGPTRLLHGPVRDLVIGTTMVRADGVVAKSGGKVVKNVAGYDLGKLLTGSFGTLGIITEVAFRLHPVPESTGWVTTEVTSSAHAAALVQAVMHSHLVATACELDRPPDGPAQLIIRLDGIAPGVAARTRDALELLGSGASAVPGPASWWGAEPGRPGDLLLKLTHEAASLTAVLDAVDDASTRCGASVAVRGSAAVGTLLVAVDGSAATVRAAVVERLRAAASGFGGSVVVLDADPESAALLDRWGPVKGLELMRRVKEQFDPDRVLSPGRFVGGI